MAENCKTDLYDVIIVGAGLSGLSAAHLLLKRSPQMNVCVLEAKDRVGGRLLTKQFESVNGLEDWDMGGAWVGQNQLHIMELLKELELETYPQHYEGKKKLQVGSNYRISEYSGDIPSLGIFSIIDVGFLLRMHAKLEKQVSAIDPSVSTNAEEMDNQTSETLFKKHAWTKVGIDAMKAAWRTMYGAEMGQTSSLYTVAYAIAGGGIEEMIASNANSSQGYKVKGGTQQICHILGQLIGDEKLRFNSPVVSLEDNFKESFVKVTLKSNEELKAKFVILAIPPNLTANIEFTPKLKPKKRDFLLSVVPGHLIKFYFTFKTAFWREAGYSGEIVTNGGPSLTPGCSMGPIGVTFDATSFQGSPALVGFIGGDQAIQYECQTFEVRREAILKSLEQFFPSQMVRDFIHYEEKIWREEPYNGGCPIAYVPPGFSKYMDEGLRQSHGRIHFASTEAAIMYPGFMSGAVESGYRAAKEVGENLGMVM